MGSVYLEIRAGDPAVRELCEAYWAEDADGEFVQKVADLAAQHGLRTGAVAEVVRGHCTARLAAMACPDCGRGVEVASRADLQSRRHVRPGLPCADCRGRAEAEAQAAAAELYERRRRMLHEHFAVTTRECTADNVRRLPLRTAVQHLALVRVAADEDLTLLRPQRVWPAVVTPGGRGDVDVLRELFESYELVLSTASDPEAFCWDEHEDPARFWYERPCWLPATEAGMHDVASAASALEEVVTHHDAWPLAWHREVHALWEELALADCLDYLGRRVEEYRLPLKVGDRLRQVLTQALEHFSIGQIYNFIWRAAKDAAAFYQKGGVVRTHAANTVPGSIQRAAERALANGWEVKIFGRDWNAPEGEMLHLLANVVTGAGDMMAWHPPSPVAERARLAPLLEQAADLVGLPIDDVVDGVRDEGTTVSELQRLVESAAPAVEDAARVWVAVFPNGRTAGPVDDPTLVQRLRDANTRADAALEPLLYAVGTLPYADAQDPLAPRSPLYFAAQRAAATSVATRSMPPAPQRSPKRDKPRKKRRRR